MVSRPTTESVRASLDDIYEWYAGVAPMTDDLSYRIYEMQQWVSGLLSTDPITPERLRKSGRGWEWDGECWETADGLILEYEHERSCELEGVPVTSMGELELELARIELAREIEEQGNADGK